MSQLFTIDVRAEGAVTRANLAGVVDELASFAPLDGLSGRVELNLAKVRRLNSIGVRLWTDAMRALGQRADVAFFECSRAVVHQLSMLPNFLGKGDVVSFHAPMRCEACDAEVDQVFETAACRGRKGLAPVPCPKCGEPMELDEIEDVYLHFLYDPSRG